MAARWRTGEDRLLARLYVERLAVREIAVQLGRSADAVVARRRALGIAPRRSPMPWSPREDSLLTVATAAGLSAPILARRLGRSTEQVRARRRKLVPPRALARPYTAGEDEALRACLTDHGDLSVLARQLGRSADALRLRAQQFGTHRPALRRRWTEQEDGLLRDGYTSALGCAEIARRLAHRTPRSVEARARKLGLATYARRWTVNEDQGLARLTAHGVTLEQAAQRLGRTPEAIRRHAMRRMIDRPQPAPAPASGRRWTGQEDELLRLHGTLNPARLAELLGRSDAAVCRRLCTLGLRADAHRSPHHPISRSHDAPTPGERATIDRELLGATARGRLALARRLAYPPSRLGPRHDGRDQRLSRLGPGG